MRIRMLKTTRGAHDGVTVRTYAEGTEHDLGPDSRALELARLFIDSGAAVDLAEEKPAPAAPLAPPPVADPPPAVEVTPEPASEPIPEPKPEAPKGKKKGR